MISVTALADALGTLLGFRLAEWGGLPPCLAADIASLFGPASAAENAILGAYPALREIYSAHDTAAGGLVVYSRAGRVIAVETSEPPPLEAMQPLEEPDSTRPPEFFLPEYSVREFLYLRRGLVLSVAQALTPGASPQRKIARCRGIRPLTAPHEYGAEYYLAFKNRILFAGT